MPEHYELTAEFKEYPGNFSRELTFWVFGEQADYMPGGWDEPLRPHAERMEWAGGGDMEGILEQVAHDEYGLVFEVVLDSHNVRCQLAEAPTDDQWNELVRAFESYRNPRNQLEPTLTCLTLKKVVTTQSIVRRFQRREGYRTDDGRSHSERMNARIT